MGKIQKITSARQQMNCIFSETVILYKGYEPGAKQAVTEDVL